MAREYEPLEPGQREPAEVARLREEWQSAPAYLRALWTIYLIVGAVGGFRSGYALTSEYKNWFAWSITLLVLEPVALTCAAALVFFYSPSSWGGVLLAKTLRRLKPVLLLLLALFLGTLSLAFTYIAVELWKLR